MKKLTKQLWLALAVAVSWVGAAVAADIQYVADNGGGEYSGAGYGISVSVSAPASGATIKYATAETGPWQEEPITYKDVCAATPIYFQISAEGYSTVVDSRTVTITPKTLTSDFVWLVLPTEDYVYDGAAKTPDAACGDGDPSIITANDFDVSYSDNVNAGIAKATFTGKGNYTGTVEEEFEIQKADNEWTTEPAMAGWTYGQAASEPTSAAKDGTAAVTYGTAGNPGSLGGAKPSLPGSYVATFTVPESQNYKALTKDVSFSVAAATVQYVADDVSGEYSGAGYGISISVSAPASGATIKYAESETGPWQDEPIVYKDVCDAKPIWFQISATGYATVTDSRTVTITPKTLTSDFVWLVLPTEDYVYDGSAKTPDAACGDGDPSIITENDFDVSYSDNVNAGTAKATFTGKGNYTGTVEEEFEIKRADNEWTTEPAMAGWMYGQTASEPTGAAKVGTAIVTYGTAANPGSLGDAKPSLPGSYAATFTVAESQNYNELVEEVEFTISPATIQYVADNLSGEYNGVGYGIDGTISVSAPASGATIKYAAAEAGPWQDDPITYKDVCNAKPIYFQISAAGYTTVVDSRTVTVTPKTLTSDFVWLVLPTEDYVYDGAAKTPDAACGDGDPSIITENDFDVSYSDNVDAGTAKATFTGKGNYTGTVEEEFDIQRADNEWTTEPAMAGWTYGQAPSDPTSAAKHGTATVTYGASGATRPTMPGSYVATFTVPESQNYNELTKGVPFTITAAAINYVADNVSGEYNGSGYGIAATISVSAPASGAVVKYSESETGPWQDEPITYRDVCGAKPIYFQISAEGYTTVTDSRTVTITPKTLTSDFVWLVLPTEDYVYDGTAKTPDAACGDGDPSIITENDFDVSYSDNVDAGTAKATFTGKGNYTGTVEEEFDIQRADNEWTTDPAMAGWTYGQAPSDPTGAAKVGTAVVTYGTAANPGSLGDAKPSLPGSYAATFTVAESQNYNELAINVEFTITAATINYVADDVSGEYNGSGFGIATTISVSAPASGATIKYGTAETGPWQDEPITYKDVCNASPIYFQISAEGYSTVIDSRTVTVTPKTLTSDFVWLVLPTEDYVYDGAAKEPDAACGDGDPSIITPNDFDVSYSDNVNAGTAKATFTGKGNYTGIVEEEFEIKRAKLTDGEEPGGGTVPAGGLSKFDVTAEYDGAAHTVDATAILEAWQGVNADVAVGYALNEDATDWTEQPESFIDVCVTSVWYKVTLENYDDFVKEVKVTITPRDIANATIAPIADVTYSGSPAEPVPTVTDGDPSIIATDDYDVSYADNVNVGIAKITLTGKQNYTGTAEKEFKIIKAGNAWTTTPAIAGWIYGQTPEEPISAAKYGTAVVTYGTAENPGSLGTTPPVQAGSYVAKFTVAATDSYNGLAAEVKFVVSPKTLTSDFVWLVLPAGDYVYDGAAKEPSAACADGEPSIISANDFDVSYSDNVNAGTAKATFTGKNNYAGTVEEVFEIKKAKLTDGEEPGGGTVPTGGLSKFDVTAEYDGAAHTVDATAILAAWQGVKADVAVGYALNKDATDWTEQPESFIDVCETSVWYKVTLANYDDFVKEVKVTITPRDIANATIEPIADVVYSGSPAEPMPTITDGDPSIITADDYDVAYADNDAPGTATLILTGKRNYAGSATVGFTIVQPVVTSAALFAEIAWKYLRTTGTYFAQLKVSCTNGLELGIDNLCFAFADRIGGDGKLNAALWHTPSRGVNSNVAEINGAPCRFVELDAALIAVENEAYVFGVTDVCGESVPVSERIIEMYTRRRVAPCAGNEARGEVDDFLGYLVWTSGGDEHVVPVLADGEDGAVALSAYLLHDRPELRLAATDAGDVPFSAEGPMPTVAAQYCGALFDEDGAVCGSVKVTLKKASRRTGARKAKLKIEPIGGRKISFTGVVGLDGTIGGTAAGYDVSLVIGENGLSGVFGTWSVACARARGASRDDIAVRVEQLKGRTYGIVLGTTDSDVGFIRENSEIMVKVFGRGKARIKGVLADGTRVSASSSVVVAGGGAVCVPVVVRAFRGKKGGFGFLLWMDGDEISVTGLSGLNTTGAKKAFDLEWDVSRCGIVK